MGTKDALASGIDDELVAIAEQARVGISKTKRVWPL
jgi:hypothetical protein